MKKLLTFLIVSMLGGHFMAAQSKIQGTVKNENNEGILLATVALYGQTDSTIAKAGTTNEDGTFVLENIKDGSYYLEVSMLGFKSHYNALVNFPDNNGKSYDIAMEPNVEILNTVEVTAKKPLLEQRADRLIVNVESMGGTHASMLDLMRRVPGMIVSNNSLRMIGQPDFSILIDGKSTRFMDVQALLRDMPGDNVKHVEVIYQPGAEFDAAGSGAIINIVLKKNKLYGTNGNFSFAGGKDYDWVYVTGLSLSHYQGKVNLNGGLGYSSNAVVEDLFITRRINGDVYDQRSLGPQNPNTFRSNFSVDWNITERQRLGIDARYSENANENEAKNTTNINFLSEDQNDLQLLTSNRNNSSWNLTSVNPYYSVEFDTNGHKLSLDANLVRLQTDAKSVLSTTEFINDAFFPGQEFDQPGQVDIRTAQLDYTYPLSKTAQLQLGGKYSDAEVDNVLDVFNENESGQWEKDLSRSNHYVFDESIKAAYIKFAMEKEHWGATFGLRYEESESVGNSITLDSSRTLNIAKVFPSFSLRKELGEIFGAVFSYSYRLDRPQYHRLNPFVYNLDPFTSKRGNPLLSPAFTHSLRLSATYEKSPFLSLEYKITDDAMVEVTEQDDETGVTFLSIVNLDSRNIFNVNFGVPLEFLFPIPKFQGYLGILASNIKYNSQYLNQDFLRSRWAFTASVEALYTLSGGFDLDISAWYSSGAQEGIILTEWTYGIGAGITKKILEDKGTLSFRVEDIANRFYRGKIQFANMDIDLRNEWFRPVASLWFKYRFGNRHLKKPNKRTGSAQEELNRTETKEN